jgi:hypothetical protein
MQRSTGYGCSLQCNKIRVIHQKPHMVITHSDCAELFLWDFQKQPDYSASKAHVRPCACIPVPSITARCLR